MPIASSKNWLVNRPIPSNNRLKIAKAISDVYTELLTSFVCLAPKNLAHKTADPAFAPRAMAMRMLTIDVEAPIAVKAVSLPENLPPIIVSAKVYNC